MIYIVSIVAAAALAAAALAALTSLLLIPVSAVVRAYLEGWKAPAALVSAVEILLTVVAFFTLGWLAPPVVTFLLTLL